MSKNAEAVRIQDDLYHAVNDEWIQQAVIPADKPATGGFMTLDEDVEKLLMADFAAFEKGEQTPDIKILEDAVRLYRKAMDTDARSEAGMKPLHPLLEKIKGIDSPAKFNEQSAELLEDCVIFPFEINVQEDWKDTTRHSFCIDDPQLLLFDPSYYEKPIVRMYMLSLYRKMATAMLKLSPLDKKEQKQYIKDTIAFDDMLRRKALCMKDQANYYKLYNPREAEEVCEMLKPFDLSGLLKKLYGENTPDTIVLSNPRMVEGFKEIYNEKNFPLFIHWCYVRTLFAYAPALSRQIHEISTQAMRKLTGVKEMPSVEKQAYRLISGVYDQPIGVYYGRKYFGEAARQDTVSIVKEIIETYEERIRKNTFLADATKEKAVLKLSSIKIKMGYPDEYDPFYDTLTVTEEETYFDARKKLMHLTKKRGLDKLNKPTDRGQWQMPAHMVNACYDPFRNDITFPAAILQKPFYSIDQKPEENLGGIGAVIGHEISHAFDSNGAHFDENGNLFDWWVEEDMKTFEGLTKKMTEQFEGIPFHGGKVSGELVCAENIADNGGMAVTIEIMHKRQNPDFEAYFKNWGRVWCLKAKEGFIKLLLKMDVHSPSELRANMMPRNFSEWYETFDVKPTDKMYIPEEKRIIIW